MKKVSIFLLAGILLANACASSATPKLIITFSADEKCTMEGPTTIPADEIVPLEIVGNIEGGGTIAIAILTLDPDKTLQDLQDWHSMDQPPWSLMNATYRFPSDGSTNSVDLSASNGPIYFVCLYESADAPLGVIGPLEVTK